MRILHIISSGGMYGAEAVILNISHTLNQGQDCSMLGTFFNSSNPNLQLHERAVEEGIEAHLIPCAGQIDRRAITRIRELATQTNADVIHAHGFKADIYVYLALRGTGIPLISTCHTWYDNDLLALCYGVSDRLVLRKYARVVAVSDEVKQRLLKAGVREEVIRLVRNGIESQRFDSAAPSLRKDFSKDAIIVGLIGRLAWEKGVDIFLRAAARVLVEFPSARFVVIGEGPDKDKLEKLMDDLKIQGSVSMLGRRNDMPSVYASLDVMVSSSRQEGLPIAILEGMASGLPLVATTVGEVPSVVLEGQTGVLVPAEDIASLADGILGLLRDPAKRKRFGVAARQRVEHEYSAARMTDHYLDVYTEAIAAMDMGDLRAGYFSASRGRTK
ncbi:MAG: glycosyltransferase family 4 protein [Edaphobacter sp.]